MAHVGKLLARLNPATVRYDIGRGGMPELTPQDIAGALAMVPAGLGRELICRLWWPDGAQLTARDLDELLRDAQLAEWRERMDAMVTAQIGVALVEDESREMLQRAHGRLESARARMWPRIGPGSCYADIRMAVLAEMSAACLCSVCKGRGQVLAEGRVVQCKACDGGGRVKVSDRGRAKAIGRDESTYRLTWRPVYEWTIELCSELIQPAQRKFRATLQN